MPSESHFEPCSPRYGLFLVCGSRHLKLLGAMLGRFRDISWSKRAAKSSLTRGSQAARGVYPPFPFGWPFRMCSRAFLAQKWLFLALSCNF